MDATQLAQWFERFQTAIVGVLGFAGVIASLFVNAWLARRDRDLALQHERTTVRTALLEELKIIKRSLEEAIRTIELCEKQDKGDLLVSTDTMSDVYDSFIPRIGLLPSEQVAKVILAYMLVLELRKSLQLLPGASIAYEHRVAVPIDSLGPLKAMHESLLPTLDDAISSLS